MMANEQAYNLSNNKTGFWGLDESVYDDGDSSSLRCVVRSVLLPGE